MFNWTDQQIDQHSNQACTEWVLSFVSWTTFRHKSCICNTIDSCRLFLHRGSSHYYLHHRQNVDPSYASSKSRNRSKKSERICTLLLKLQSGKPQIIFSSQWQFLKDPHLALILESTFQRLIARASTQDRGHNFSQYGPAWASELNFYYFFFLNSTEFFPKEAKWFRAVITGRSSINWTIFERGNGT